MLPAKNKKILLVEDEPHLAFNLQLNLKDEGCSVTLATSGAEAIAIYTEHGPFDLVILDVNIPEPNGFQVARYIRARDLRTAIIMLTARATDQDRVAGLEIGVDDYICKPFHLKELLLKVKRVAERAELFNKIDHDAGKHLIQIGPFTLNTESLELIGPKGSHSLTALECDVLKAFMDNYGRVLSREYLLENVWGVRGRFETRTVDNFIVRLRRYLEEDPANPIFLESVRGRGYRLNNFIRS